MVMDHGHKSIAAGVFKARCLAILEEVGRTKETIIVTKRGRPVARIMPVVDSTDAESLEGSIVHQEEIVGPFHDAWESR